MLCFSGRITSTRSLKESNRVQFATVSCMSRHTNYPPSNVVHATIDSTRIAFSSGSGRLGKASACFANKTGEVPVWLKPFLKVIASWCTISLSCKTDSKFLQFTLTRITFRLVPHNQEFRSSFPPKHTTPLLSPRIYMGSDCPARVIDGILQIVTLTNFVGERLLLFLISS